MALFVEDRSYLCIDVDLSPPVPSPKKRELTDYDGATILHKLCLQDDSEGVRDHLYEFERENGVRYLKAYLNEENRLRKTALFIACERGCLDVVKVLADYRLRCLIRMHMIYYNNFGPFQIACMNGHLSVVMYLADTCQLTNMFSYTDESYEGLVLALSKKRTDVVNFLLSNVLEWTDAYKRAKVKWS